jgi:hypothetical protein
VDAQTTVAMRIPQLITSSQLMISGGRMSLKRIRGDIPLGRHHSAGALPMLVGLISFCSNDSVLALRGGVEEPDINQEEAV